MGYDILLIGWKRIHEELFIDDVGKPMISMSTLMQKHGSGLKACGAVFAYRRGKARTHSISGWKSVIQNYFIKLGQIEDAERVKKKAIKKAQKADLNHAALD